MGEINEQKNGEEIKESINQSKDTIPTNELESKPSIVKERDFELKNGRNLFRKGNQASKGRPKSKPFSVRDDVIAQLKKLKHKNRKEYDAIIYSYIKLEKMRQFLLEVIDGKARQSMEIGGNSTNPIRTIEVKAMETPLLPELSSPQE